jgi:polyisoprenyl-phosphate glycosyltransferase
MASRRRRVSIVIPFFNEEANIVTTLSTIDEVVSRLIEFDWEVVAVNDGSRDATLAVLERYSPRCFDLVTVDLSRNFGKEAALSAGLMNATGEAAVPMDADLQDPPELIEELLKQWQLGFEVVLAKRIDRSSDTLPKRASAKFFYTTINRLSDIHIPENVGDFRLIDRVVIDVLNALPENRRFMKGLFAWAGFRSTSVPYVRPERQAGISKFSGWRLWNLAVEGITSFSTVPLRIWTYLGSVVAASALLYGGYIIIRTLVHGIDVPGYASLLTVVLFVGGVQLIGLGVIGEYLGRVYMESKRRPAFVVRRVNRTSATPR